MQFFKLIEILCVGRNHIFQVEIWRNFAPKKTNTDSVVRAPINHLSFHCLTYFTQRNQRRKQTPFPCPFPPNLGRKIQAQNGKPKKKIQSRKIMYQQQNFIQSNLKKICRYQKESTYIPLGRFFIKNNNLKKNIILNFKKIFFPQYIFIFIYLFIYLFEVSHWAVSVTDPHICVINFMWLFCLFFFPLTSDNGESCGIYHM